MRLSLIALGLTTLLLFAWHLIADRQTPFTANARIKAVIVPITPQVSGPVAVVAVSENALVAQADVLLQIDQTPYLIAVEQAKAHLQQTIQDVGAASAGIESAQSTVARSQTNLKNTQLQADRIFALEAKQLIAISKADETRAALAKARAEFAATQADLQQEMARLGATGSKNPQVALAVANLDRAKLDLDNTTLRAPSAGVALGQTVGIGMHAKAGQPLMTFISSETIWIEAYFTENNLGHINTGDPVEITLDMHPGRILNGVVSGFSGAVSNSKPAQAGDLPNAEHSSGWLREAQRFPVIIRLPEYASANDQDDLRTQINGQADVIIYTGENAILNAIGRFWIRLNATLSYAY